jgi:hypothetical protein
MGEHDAEPRIKLTFILTHIPCMRMYAAHAGTRYFLSRQFTRGVYAGGPCHLLLTHHKSPPQARLQTANTTRTQILDLRRSRMCLVRPSQDTGARSREARWHHISVMLATDMGRMQVARLPGSRPSKPLGTRLARLMMFTETMECSRYLCVCGSMLCVSGKRFACMDSFAGIFMQQDLLSCIKFSAVHCHMRATKLVRKALVFMRTAFRTCPTHYCRHS